MIRIHRAWRVEHAGQRLPGHARTAAADHTRPGIPATLQLVRSAVAPGRRRPAAAKQLDEIRHVANPRATVSIDAVTVSALRALDLYAQRSRPSVGPASLQKSCSERVWWAREELNLRPLPCQQTTGNRCARSRSPRSRATVEGEVTKEKAGYWTRRSAFAQVRCGSNIQLLPYSLVSALFRSPVEAPSARRPRAWD